MVDAIDAIKILGGLLGNTGGSSGRVVQYWAIF